jgi:hypothetical protein
MRDKFISLPKTLEDLVDEYQTTKAHLETSLAYYQKAQKVARLSAGVYIGISGENALTSELKSIKRMYWNASLELSNVKKLMDASALRRLQSSFCSTECPDFTIETLRSTYIQAYSQADEMFTSGLIEVFKQATGNYKTNDAFKVGRKMILDYMVDYCMYGGSLSLSHNRQDYLNDLDRVVRILDKAKEQEAYTSMRLPNEIDTALRNKKTTLENTYFKIKCFKKGTIHIEFKSQYVVNKINKAIANYYGQTVGFQ